MEIEKLLSDIRPISLEEMSGVKLMNRIDTKFLTSVKVLEQLLECAREDFLIQESNLIRNAPYYTRYYDTTDVRMYKDHERGKKSRRKVRIRQYVGTGLNPFLEIKDKNNKGRTKKKRIQIGEGEPLGAHDDFISRYSEFRAEELYPTMENRFNRITLVNKERTERITIDTSVEFHNFVSDKRLSLPDLVIIEWKRDGMSSKSRLKPLLRKLRIKESGFSKYVVGMALTDIKLPRHRLKSRFKLIEKIIS